MHKEVPMSTSGGMDSFNPPPPSVLEDEVQQRCRQIIFAI
jgi:hypothetical protein